MSALAPLPTRREEAWRYADLEALEKVWPDVAGRTDRIAVPEGGHEARSIVLTPGSEGVAVVDLDIALAKDARYDLHILAAGADYGRVHVRATLSEGAHFELGGAILGAGEQTLEIVTEVRHEAPNATSNQVVRSVLGDTATGSFLGKVHVARGAQKTDAQQSVKSMLLDRAATANAKPELEIFADDVKCAHGATVGELDKCALFYMASRGLPPADARRLMLRAFIADAFVAMEEGGARDDIEAAALDRLEALL